VFEEQRLDGALHDRKGFDCGVPALNDYLLRFAEQHRKKGISSTYVLVDPATPRTILGYYSLSAAQVDADALSEAERKKLPRYPIPCFRMGRLACRLDRRGEGLGRLLLGCAVDRCLSARQQVGAYALLVDAKDETAKAFYLRYGFIPCQDHAMTLYLALAATT
jgi:GNAT superfamily N-acetyltransferase